MGRKLGLVAVSASLIILLTGGCLEEGAEKKVVIVETAWSSAGPRGSEERQARYVEELSGVLDQRGERVLFLSWFVLYDLPQSLNREIARRG